MKVHYDIPDLRAFCELARTGSFTRAAENLAVTTSALSRRIAKLEGQVGGELVTRSTRAMTLTSLGRRLLARAEPLLNALDESVREASRIALGQEGQLVVGCVSSIAYAILPQAIARFRQLHPDMRVHLTDGQGPEITAELLDQKVEFAITTHLSQSAEFEVEEIARDPFVVVCGAAHPMARKKKTTWAALAGQRIAGFKAASSTRRVLDEALMAQQVRLDWFDEVDGLSSLIGYLRSGHFVSVVPRLLAEHIPDAGVIPIVDRPIERRIYLARLRGNALSVPGSALWRAVADAASETTRNARP